MPAADELRTARLWLRRWRVQDEGPLAAINEDPAVTRYLNRAIDRAATAAFYADVQQHWAEHGFGFYAVEWAGGLAKNVPTEDVSRKTPPESVADGPGFVGFVGVAHPTFVPELAARPELGWRLARRAWGRGLATEAARAVRDHAFKRLALPELISIVHPDNARSQRVATKLGMTAAQRVRIPGLEREADVWRLVSPDLR